MGPSLAAFTPWKICILTKKNFIFLTFIFFSVFRHFHNDDDDDVEYNITSIQMVVQSENEEKFEYTGGVTSVREFLSLRPSHHTYVYVPPHCTTTSLLHPKIFRACVLVPRNFATKLQCQFLNT